MSSENAANLSVEKAALYDAVAPHTHRHSTNFTCPLSEEIFRCVGNLQHSQNARFATMQSTTVLGPYTNGFWSVKCEPNNLVQMYQCRWVPQQKLSIAQGININTLGYFHIVEIICHASIPSEMVTSGSLHKHQARSLTSNYEIVFTCTTVYPIAKNMGVSFFGILCFWEIRWVT